MIDIVPCGIWNARPVNNAALDRQPGKGILVHHTAGPLARVLWPAPLERIRCLRLARNIQSAHMQGNGWRDSGHHFLISRSGYILEGRHGSLEAAKHGLVIHGAHAGDNEANQTMFGVENEGTYTSAEMPIVQWEALVNLAAHLCLWADIQSQELHGHRDVRATQCPGDALYAALPRLRQEVHARKLALLADWP